VKYASATENRGSETPTNSPAVQVIRSALAKPSQPLLLQSPLGYPQFRLRVPATARRVTAEAEAELNVARAVSVTRRRRILYVSGGMAVKQA